jgi:hypothetical protein
LNDPPFGDLAGVPERAVLVGEQDEVAVLEARFASGVVQEHHREQSVDLGLVRHQLGERPPEPEGLGRQVNATSIALVEDEVDDREHGREPIGQQVVGRHPEGDPGRLDLPLRPHEPLRHGRLGDEKGARDLLGRQSAEGPQREGDLGVECEGRVAAGEHELEPLVWQGHLIRLVLDGLGNVQEAGLRGQRSVAANAVDCAVSGRRHEPEPRVGRDAVARPAFRRDREGFLRGFLGEVEIAEEADEGSEDAPPLVAEDLLEDRYCSLSGRTSIAPP